MLSAGQAIMDWLANSAMGYVIDEKASGDGELRISGRSVS